MAHPLVPAGSPQQTISFLKVSQCQFILTYLGSAHNHLDDDQSKAKREGIQRSLSSMRKSFLNVKAKQRLWRISFGAVTFTTGILAKVTCAVLTLNQGCEVQVSLCLLFIPALSSALFPSQAIIILFSHRLLSLTV